MSNKKLLVDLSKSILPTSFLPNSIKYQQLNGTLFNNGSKLLSNFSSPRSSRSSCSTCSTSCTSTSATTTSTYTTTATSTTTNNNNTTLSSLSSSNSSSIISLNLSSSSSSECNSNCSKLHTNSNSLSSSSILTTSISINSSVSQSSSSSSSYFSTDEHPDTLFDDDYNAINNNNDDNNNTNSKNSINNSYVCNSSDSSAATTSSNRTNPSTITKITRSTSNLLNISAKTNNKSNNDINKSVIAAATAAAENEVKVQCMWNKCKFIGNATDVDDSLIEHIKSKHIFNQKCLRTFRCMWKGCSVFKKSSCSFNWLERHVIDHIDTKPFLCIFNGCKRKFRTEAARERHVQCHINTSENTSSQPNSPIKTRNHLLLKSAQNLIQNIKNKNENLKLNDNTPALITNAAAKLGDIKISNGNGINSNNSKNDNKTKINELPDYTQILKALTKKRKVLTSECAGGKKFIKAQFKDYIDECTMSVVDFRLKNANYQSGEILLKARVIGTKPKSENNKNEMLLVEWIPNNILENEWINKTEFTKTKKVNIRDLKFDNKQLNSINQLYRPHRLRQNKRK